MEFILFWFIFCILVGWYASNLGRSGFGWFFLSLFISPLLGFLFAAIAGKTLEKKKEEYNFIRGQSMHDETETERKARMYDELESRWQYHEPRKPVESKPRSALAEIMFVVILFVIIGGFGLFFHYNPFSNKDSVETEVSRPKKSSPPKVINVDENTKRYAGEYRVHYSDKQYGDSEKFILKEDGSAVWVYVNNSGGTSKSGHWTATKSSIIIRINGNIGPITERYHAKDGQMRHVDNYNQYLINN